MNKIKITLLVITYSTGEPDYSYHGRFVPWIFRTILGLFIPLLNSDVSKKLDDAESLTTSHRLTVWTDNDI